MFDGFIKESSFSISCNCFACQASCCKDVCLFDAGFKVDGSNQIEITSIIGSMKPRFNFQPGQLRHEQTCCSNNGGDILWTVGRVEQVLVVNLSAETWSELPPVSGNTDILGKKCMEQVGEKALVEHLYCTSLLIARGIHDCQHFLLLEHKQDGEYILYDSLEGEKEHGEQLLRPEDRICALVLRPGNTCFFKDSVLRGKRLEKYERFIRSPVKKNHLKIKSFTRGNKDNTPTHLLKSTCSKLKKIEDNISRTNKLEKTMGRIKEKVIMNCLFPNGSRKPKLSLRI